MLSRKPYEYATIETMKREIRRMAKKNLPFSYTREDVERGAANSLEGAWEYIDNVTKAQIVDAELREMRQNYAQMKDNLDSYISKHKLLASLENYSNKIHAVQREIEERYRSDFGVYGVDYGQVVPLQIRALKKKEQSLIDAHHKLELKLYNNTDMSADMAVHGSESKSDSDSDSGVKVWSGSMPRRHRHMSAGMAVHGSESKSDSDSDSGVKIWSGSLPPRHTDMSAGIAVHGSESESDSDSDSGVKIWSGSLQSKH